MKKRSERRKHCSN